MSTATTEPAVRATSSDGEKRILIPRATWALYQNFVELLPDSTPVRVAFDGRSMEIMVKGPIHDHFARYLEAFLLTVASELGTPVMPQGETTWIRPELERGIEADNCYYLDPMKIRAAQDAITRRTNDVADYPNPDLAIEVDISPPQADRMGIYAALRVAELWIFNGQSLTIYLLNEQGHYERSEASRYLPVRSDQVQRWLTEEDLTDYNAWIQRIRAWAARELRPSS